MKYIAISHYDSSSHQIKCESLVTIVTPKYGVMCRPHHYCMKYTPNLV